MVQESLVLDHTIREMIEHLSAHRELPIYELTPQDARYSLLQLQSGPVQKPDVQIKDWKVNSEAGPLRFRTIRPVHTVERTPVILYFHGGGWVIGDATTHDRLVRLLAAGANATLVFVDYGRAPEHRYPLAIEQAYAATKYVSEHSEELGVDSTYLAVAGESSGGNMATVVSLLARQRVGPRIAGQLLLYPATNADFETESYRRFSKGPWLTRAAMQWFWDQYLPDHGKRRDPTASHSWLDWTNLPASLPPSSLLPKMMSCEMKMRLMVAG